MTLLQNGWKFPQLEIPAVGGGMIKLPNPSPARLAWC